MTWPPSGTVGRMPHLTQHHPLNHSRVPLGPDGRRSATTISVIPLGPTRTVSKPLPTVEGKRRPYLVCCVGDWV